MPNLGVTQERGPLTVCCHTTLSDTHVEITNSMKKKMKLWRRQKLYFSGGNGTRARV
jgi:hypothetical protein